MLGNYAGRNDVAESIKGRHAIELLLQTPVIMRAKKQSKKSSVTFCNARHLFHEKKSDIS